MVNNIRELADDFIVAGNGNKQIDLADLAILGIDWSNCHEYKSSDGTVLSLDNWHDFCKAVYDVVTNGGASRRAWTQYETSNPELTVAEVLYEKNRMWESNVSNLVHWLSSKELDCEYIPTLEPGNARFLITLPIELEKFSGIFAECRFRLAKMESSFGPRFHEQVLATFSFVP